MVSEIAARLMADGKGILASDESLSSMESRFRDCGIRSTPEVRTSYRELLFGAPGLSSFISGGILFDETLRAQSAEGQSIPDFIRTQGIIVGARADEGVADLARTSGEKISRGLDNLAERLSLYAKAGVEFAKWRADIRLGHGRPSQWAIEANANVLARFAAEALNFGILPIVEPDVSIDGPHSLEECYDATARILDGLMHTLFRCGVGAESLILKSSMVLPGLSNETNYSDKQIAEATIKCFRNTVPPSIGGVVLLSGGQNEIVATRRLQEISLLNGATYKIGFSFNRGLTDTALGMWRGDADSVDRARQELLKRAKFNSLARSGLYTTQLEALPTISSMETVR